MAETPSYENVKCALCKERRKTLGIIQNSKDSSEIHFPSELLLLPNQESFMRLDFTNEIGKRIPVFAGEGFQNLLKNDDFFYRWDFQKLPKTISSTFNNSCRFRKHLI